MLAAHIFTNFNMLQLNFRHKNVNVALIPAPLKWSNMSGIIGQCANFGIYYYQ